jgi:hypothetical protein
LDVVFKTANNALLQFVRTYFVVLNHTSNLQLFDSETNRNQLCCIKKLA